MLEHAPGADRHQPAAPPDTLPTLALDHLDRLTGEFGLFEHAEFDQPRCEHGYTTDDNARALVLFSRLPTARRPPNLGVFRDFVTAARVPMGWRNRMSASGEWLERRGSDDAHGRALWGLGCLFESGEHDDDVVAAFLAGLDFRSNHPRANAYAALGAVAAWDANAFRPEVAPFLARLLPHLHDLMPRSGTWRWPEPRLAYDNARIPQAMISVGSIVGEPRLIEGGLSLLTWLIDTESGPDGFSFTPTSGRGPDELGPAFDQQPLEAWAMADACVTASAVDNSSLWTDALRRSALWFLGLNDSGSVLYDERTGAGYDGLEAEGVNQNRGAESTLSALAALLAAGADA